MTHQANALFTVSAAGEVDEYSGGTPLVPTAWGVPGEFIERDRTIRDPVTGDARVVRQVLVKVPFDVDVSAGDRLTDEDTGRVYPVRDVHQYRSGGRSTDKVCDVVDLSNRAP